MSEIKNMSLTTSDRVQLHLKLIVTFLKDKPEYQKFNNFQILNYILNEYKALYQDEFEIQTEHDDIDNTNSILTIFKDCNVISNEKEELDSESLSESEHSDSEITNEPIVKEKKLLVKKEEKKLLVKKEENKPKTKTKSSSPSSNENKSNDKRGRPKLPKTIWKEIIKKDQNWNESNSFIKNFIEEYDEKHESEDSQSFKNEQIELLKKYELNIISKIYTMLSNTYYTNDLLTTVYKKNDSILNDLQNDSTYLKEIKNILNVEILSNEKKLIDKLLQEDEQFLKQEMIKC
jgi:hypothetical protein